MIEIHPPIPAEPVTPPKPAPLCVDCRHCRFDAETPGLSRCAAVKTRINLVNGEQQQQFCDIARNFSFCGAAGQLFETKELLG